MNKILEKLKFAKEVFGK